MMTSASITDLHSTWLHKGRFINALAIVSIYNLFMRKILLLAVLLPATASAQIVSGTAQVVDGDTLKLGDERIRLHGIDAPEASQTCKRNDAVWHCGRDATLLLNRFVNGQQVSCTQQDEDNYGRVVATCRVERLDLGEALVRAGLAIALPQYSSAYVDAEATAKSFKIGLWSSEFQSPASYRSARVQTQSAS